MMTLSVSSGTWSDALTAIIADLQEYVAAVDDEDGDFKTFHAELDSIRHHVDHALRAALREVNIEVKVEVQDEIPI